MRLKISAILLATTLLAACSTNKAQHWLKKQPSAMTLKPVVYKDVDLTEFQKQYYANKSTWDKAFQFMATHNLEELAPGKYPIDGENVFASITESVDKRFEDTKWEAHKKYIDLQYIIRGKEKMGEASFENEKVIRPYDAAHDIAIFDINGGKFYVADSSTFYLFFPGTTHRPSIMVNQEKVKKLVIKIRVAE
ncbi:YhcH/YjgK/YiaL family protein [Pedobacter arcticus]|uniref:YhcH/YjgK/YiaL family protein n=1 Tax=Pedobacter arcticus TaxID=752140 RepID=UPI0003739309|nr:YhcH/YjgK/YiaL family protein [Pedobacter arcticus]